MFTVEFIAPTVAAAERICRLYEYFCRMTFGADGVHRVNSCLTRNRKGYKVIATTGCDPRFVYDWVSSQMIREFRRGNSLRRGTHGEYRILLLADYGE